MLLTEYLDTIQGTDQEQQFIEKLAELKVHFEPAAKVPIFGKTIKALIALGDASNIEDFKQSEHYNNIQGYNIAITDIEKGYFSIHPGKAQLVKLVPFFAIIGGVILLLILSRKRCRSCSK